MKKLINLITVLVLLSCSKIEKKVFILPYKFTGDVQLYYDIKEIEAKQKFIVPENGKIYTSEKFEPAYLDNKFFILDSIGNKMKLRVFDKNDKSNCNELGVLRQYTATYDELDRCSYVFRVDYKKCY